MSDNTTTVQMSPEQLAAFEKFQAEENRKEQQEREKAMRNEYRQMVDDEIEASLPELLALSQDLRQVKTTILGNFRTLIEMKGDLFKLKGKDMDNQSHTFTNTKGNKRIIIGNYVQDGYLDTANEGIAIVKEYIEGLANTEESRVLLRMVMSLLAKDSKGTLKASKILQLRKMADESGNERFIEGVKIITEAYTPNVSKQFIRCEIKNELGQWKSVPLGMTES